MAPDFAGKGNRRLAQYVRANWGLGKWLTNSTKVF